MSYLILGTISLTIGVIAFVIPLFPSFPFLLLTFILYSKSSDKMVNWFMSTTLYKQSLESYLNGEGLTKGSKIKIMIVITMTLSIGAFFSKNIQWVLWLLFIIWLFHLLYFTFRVKTKDNLEQ